MKLKGREAGKTIHQLSDELANAREAIRICKETEESIKSDILDLYSEYLRGEYSKKDEPFGSVSIEDSGLKLTFTTPKKVTWDQGILAEIYKEAGSEYVKVKYDVSEAAYKGWSQAIRNEFVAARTVEPGQVVVKIEGVE